jgi:nitroreductase
MVRELIVRHLKSMFPLIYIKYLKINKNLIRRKNIKGDFEYDLNRYLKYSIQDANFKTRNQFESFLIKEYHAIEKALSLENPRPGFGLDRVIRLIDSLNRYKILYGSNKIINICNDVIIEYELFNKDYFRTTQQEHFKSISDYVAGLSSLNQGGTLNLSKNEILTSSKINFTDFFKSRHSVRDFLNENLNYNEIADAVDTARYTPSACNRQAWHVYYLNKNNKEQFDLILNNQNGNLGFRENIDSLLIITGSIESFADYERNQVYIDSGMFSMSLLLALHSKGIATCCLNTSFDKKSDMQFRSIVSIKETETPIMIIALGTLKEKFKVAQSNRKSLNEILTII